MCKRHKSYQRTTCRTFKQVYLLHLPVCLSLKGAVPLVHIRGLCNWWQRLTRPPRLVTLLNSWLLQPIYTSTKQCAASTPYTAWSAAGGLAAAAVALRGGRAARAAAAAEEGCHGQVRQALRQQVRVHADCRRERLLPAARSGGSGAAGRAAHQLRLLRMHVQALTWQRVRQGCSMVSKCFEQVLLVCSAHCFASSNPLSSHRSGPA